MLQRHHLLKLQAKLKACFNYLKIRNFSTRYKIERPVESTKFIQLNPNAMYMQYKIRNINAIIEITTILQKKNTVKNKP